jgi:hypothetical protein
VTSVTLGWHSAESGAFAISPVFDRSLMDWKLEQKTI